MKCLGRSVEIVEFLLEQDDLEMMDGNGRPLLHLCAAQHLLSPKVAEALKGQLDSELKGNAHFHETAAEEGNEHKAASHSS